METEVTTARKPRRTLTYADRLREMDEAYAARAKRDDARVADAEEALNDAKMDRLTHKQEHDTKRAEIVNKALAQADELQAPGWR